MSESWRAGSLLACVTATMAVQGAVRPGDVQLIVVNALLGGSLVLAFEIARTARPLRLFSHVLAAAGVAVAVLRAVTDTIGEGEARVMSAALVVFGPPAIAVGVIRSLRTHGRVRLSAVLGVLSLYILLGLLFAFVYGAIDELGTGTFFTNGEPATVAECQYFSFTTLTTVGYGDLTARTDLGHTLAVFEALAGQIYLVTVVSLIVGNLGRARPRR
jgi:ion channel